MGFRAAFWSIFLRKTHPTSPFQYYQKWSSNVLLSRQWCDVTMSGWHCCGHQTVMWPPAWIFHTRKRKTWTLYTKSKWSDNLDIYHLKIEFSHTWQLKTLKYSSCAHSVLASDHAAHLTKHNCVELWRYSVWGTHWLSFT